MAKPNHIELPTGERIAILFEDRSVLAIDKPRGWMLAPDAWTRTARNLQAALAAGIAAREFWAKSRNLRFLRFVHRLDTETTGVVLLAKSKGALSAYSGLFESRHMEKLYLAVVKGTPERTEWVCRLRLKDEIDESRKIRVDAARGKETQTRFRVLKIGGATSLLEARPLTGRTHQIRVHLAESGYPVIGDDLYGVRKKNERLSLRAVALNYIDPFTRQSVEIQAPVKYFLREYGFAAAPQPSW